LCWVEIHFLLPFERVRMPFNKAVCMDSHDVNPLERSQIFSRILRSACLWALVLAMFLSYFITVTMSRANHV
jgi:hypothetical protein